MSQRLRKLKNFWRFCVKPSGKRFGGHRSRPPGVALLSVMMGLALMSSVVTEMSYNEMVRYKLAIYERDSVKAESLAHSGLNIARLLLAAQGAIQPMLTQLAAAQVPLPAHTLWQLIPLESDLLKGMTSGALQSTLGMDVSEALSNRSEAMAEMKTQIAEDFDPEAAGVGLGPFEPPEGGFGAFDGGFSVEIKDEESKVSLRGWTTQLTPQGRYAYAQRLFGMLQPEKYDFLFEDRDEWGNRVEREDLVAHIYDYIDSDQEATEPSADMTQWGRMNSGSEDGNYTSYQDIEPKNAFFDTLQELRLVHGISDAHMLAFADSLTIYGEGKINLLSANPRAMEMLIRMCAMDISDPSLQDPQWMTESLSMWDEYRFLTPDEGGGPLSPTGFKSFLQDNRFMELNTEICDNTMTTESKNFSVRSTGVVGDVTRAVTMVMRVHGAAEELYFYQVE